MVFRRSEEFPWVRWSIGVAAAEYLRLIRNTREFGIDPADFYLSVGEPAPEEVQLRLESRLNCATESAYAIAEGRAKDFDWGRGHIGDTQLS
jgi:hypothetical protein